MSTFKLGGAPLHPALVHFPIAAWTTALVADGVFLFSGQPLAWSVAYWALAVGVLAGLGAMALGWLDFVLLGAEHPALPHVQQHMWFMSGAWSVFLLDLLLRPRDVPAEMAWWLAVITLVGFMVLAIGGHLGARLVYHHGINAGAGRATH